jgi:hypothetical protein
MWPSVIIPSSILMTPQLAEILRRDMYAASTDREAFLDSAITPDVGEFLQDLIRQRKPTTTLEVGLAYGISGLFICEALRECGGKRYVALNRAYTVKACTEPVADYRPSNIARILRGAASYSTAARKLLKSKFVTPDDAVEFTPDCRCVAFEKLSDHARHWGAHQEF